MKYIKYIQSILLALTFSIAGLGLLFKPAAAITGPEVVSAGSVWLETTIAVALAFVTVMALSLQIARGYFMRVLNKFTLRLGADIWWLAYVLIRDGLMFMAFVMSLLVFFPGTFQDYQIAVPFMPLTTVFFGIALILKLYFDADENRQAFRAVTFLTFLGTACWIFGTIFILETPLALNPLPPGVSATGGIWYTLFYTFSSTTPTGLAIAMYTFEATLPVLGVLGILGLAHPILHSKAPKLKKLVSPTLSTSPSVATPATRIADKPETVRQ